MLQYLLWCILYADLNGYEFVLTDIPDIELMTMRNEDNQHTYTMDIINDYMAIKKNYKNINEINENNVLSLDVAKAYEFVQQNINYSHSCDGFLKFKNLFFSGKKSRFDTTVYNVAIHIRKMGKSESKYYPYSHDRYGTDLTMIKDLINQIKTQITDKKVLFHIYSCGNNDFSAIQSDEVILHIEENVIDTFNDLVFADALVMSTSSFSYVAGLLSNSQRIYYPKFWHPPLAYWILI